MVIYPVLDLQGGLVVRAVAGERRLYRPVTSSLVESAEPVDVARAFRLHFDLEDLYLADLDALAGRDPSLDVYKELLEDGFRILLDAGLRSCRDAHPLLELGVDRLVAALESLPSPRVLEELISSVGVKSIVFSLDLKDGEPLGDTNNWPATAEEVARRASEAGVEEVLLLDLRQVGTGGGPRQMGLLRKLGGQIPTLRWLTGGGVRGLADLRELEAAGVAGVLVASALHDGSLRPAEVKSVHEPGRA